MVPAPLNKQVLEFIAQKEAAGVVAPGTGIAVSLVKDGEVIFKGAYGLRDRERNLPVTPETVFEICSLTKAFTVTSLLLASERGQIDLDRPINASRSLLLLNDLELSRQLTVKDVLTHRTGLPANDVLWYFGSPETSLRSAIERLEIAPNAFRKSFIYNNLLYGCVGDLFEEWVGSSWESHVAQNILAPLRMTSTSFKVSVGEQNIALPYVGTRQVKRLDMKKVAAAGAIRSNIEDMSRWMAFQLGDGKTSSGERLLSESSIQLMQSKQIAITEINPVIFQGLEWLGAEPGYGMGWFVSSIQGMKAVFHPGLVDGFSVAIVMIPEKKLGAVALCNSNLSAIPGLLVQKLLDSVLSADNETVTKKMPVSSASQDLAVIGGYQNPVFGSISIEANEDSLVMNYNGNRWPLAWKGESSAELTLTLFCMQVPLPVQFEFKDGKAQRVLIPLSMDPRIAPQAFTRSR